MSLLLFFVIAVLCGLYIKRRIYFTNVLNRIPTVHRPPFWIWALKHSKALSPVQLAEDVLDITNHDLRLLGHEGILVSWLAWVPIVSVSNPAFLEQLFTSTKNITKSDLYFVVAEWLKTGLLTSTGQKWKSRRKMITPTFHFRILENFLSIMDKHSKTLVRKLKEKENQSFDITHIISLFTLDTILDTAMGTTIDALENDLCEYVVSIKQAAEVAIYRTFFPWYWNKFIFYHSPFGRQYLKSVNYMHNFTRNFIEKRKKELVESGLDDEDPKRKKRFLDMLLEHHLKDRTLTEEDIREEVDTFTFEGNDTTATGISFTLYLLGHYPSEQEKVQLEVDEMFNYMEGEELTMEDLKKLKYTECVIKESLRLFPPVPVIGRILETDVQLGKYIIPKGVNVIFPIQSLHLDPKLYPQHLQFQPERFLPENSKEQNPFAYVPFAAGPRNCIGQKFAMNEMKVCISYVIKHFTLQSIEKRDQLHIHPEIVLKSKNGLKIKIKSR